MNNENKGFDFFNNIYVVHLERSTERYEHIIKEFERVGIEKYRFFNAVNYDDEQVKNLYLSGFIKKYPPCFRCDSDKCSCANNILIPQQVGNWCSFINLMREIIDKNYEGLVMICEDDIEFIGEHQKIINKRYIIFQKCLIHKTSTAITFEKWHIVEEVVCMRRQQNRIPLSRNHVCSYRSQQSTCRRRQKEYPDKNLCKKALE